MTVINFLYAEPYPDCLENFFLFGLRDFVQKHKNYNLVINGKGGDVILDIKFHFVNVIKNMKGIKILYFPDAYGDYKDLFDVYGDIYDYVFFPTKNSLIDNKRCFNVSFGYCPYTHYSVQRKKKIDVCFIGTKHQDRSWIRDIPNIKIYGDGWGEGVYPVYGAKKRAIVAQSKIILNYHLENEANMRDYEMLASRAFMLGDIIPVGLERGMAKYDNFDDLCDKIDYYLKHEDEREEIVRKGREVVFPYTYERRIKEIIEKIR